MSLLLDALKKAADEKEKNKNNAVENQQSSQQRLDEQPDLDLDLVSEEYPDVDENPTKSDSGTEADETVIKAEDISSDRELELAPGEEHEERRDAISIVAEEAENRSVTAADNRYGRDAGLPERRKPQPSKFDRTVQYDPAALDALINQSNMSSRATRLRKKLIYSAVIGLFVLCAAAYFTFEVVQSTESIYVADTAPIKAANTNPPVETSTKKSPEKTREPTVLADPAPAPVNARIAKPGPVAKAASVRRVNTDERKVTIIQKRIEDPTNQLLNKAYSAFNEGDYTTARNSYQSVLELDVRNRDALLGLAAVAVKEQRFDYAQQKYMQILYLDPGDSYAKAGLNSIEQQQGNAYNESQLKMMLREQPEAAHLHFALGALYAGQNKWPEAQASFFNAWSLKSGNADYAFNLAVSLDHLDKHKQAIELYELSLNLHKASTSNFSRDDVQSRIKALNNASKDSN